MAQRLPKTYTSKRLRFALCDPQGCPHLIAHSFDLCLGQYVNMRKGIILGEESRRQYFEVMLKRKWSIRHATISCTVGPVGILKLPRGKDDKAAKGHRT